MALASDGTLYYAFGGYDPGAFEVQVFLARSSDLGRTWRTTALPRVAKDLSRGEVGIDGVPSLAVDSKTRCGCTLHGRPTGGAGRCARAPGRGKEHYWDIVIRPHVATWADGGATFTPPVSVAEGLRATSEMEGVKTPPQVLVGKSGEVHVVFGERTGAGPREAPQGDAPPASIYLATSTDGGRTYEGRRVYTEPAPVNPRTAFLWPARGAVDHQSGTIYVVWEELSNAGQRCRSPSSARSTEAARGPSRSG